MNLSEEHKRTTGNSPTIAWLVDAINTKLAFAWDEATERFVSLINVSATQGYRFLVERMGGRSARG